MLVLIEENIKGTISLDGLACEIFFLVYFFPSSLWKRTKRGKWIDFYDNKKSIFMGHSLALYKIGIFRKHANLPPPYLFILSWEKGCLQHNSCTSKWLCHSWWDFNDNSIIHRHFKFHDNTNAMYLHWVVIRQWFQDRLAHINSWCSPTPEQRSCLISGGIVFSLKYTMTYILLQKYVD